MIDIIERILVIQLMKTMAHSKSEEQREMLDVILDGGMKVVNTIANVRSIQEKQGTIISTKPLARYEPEFYKQQNERILGMMEKPQPPKQLAQPEPQQPGILNTIFEEISLIRSKVIKYNESGMIGQKELTELDTDLYSVLLRIYSASNKI